MTIAQAPGAAASEERQNPAVGFDAGRTCEEVSLLMWGCLVGFEPFRRTWMPATCKASYTGSCRQPSSHEHPDPVRRSGCEPTLGVPRRARSRGVTWP